MTRVQRGARTAFALAAAIPSSESDLAALTPAVLQGRLAAERDVSVGDPVRGPEETDTRWAWLAVACVGCLAAEPILLRVFRT